MSRRILHRLLCLLGLLLAGCCSSPLLEELNRPLPDHAAANADASAGRYQLPSTTAYTARKPAATITVKETAAPPQTTTPTPAATPAAVKPKVVQVALQGPTDPDEGVRAAAAQGKQPPEKGPLQQQLEIPQVIPGSKTATLDLPSTKEPEKRAAALARYFPALPPLPPVDPGQPGPDGQPLTLADLQKIAAENSPVLRQAVADVVAARGNAIQVGLPPNPIAGYEGDAANQMASAGIQGFFVDQNIITWGKLGLARAAALYDVRNSEQKLRKAQAELQTQVRQNYFSFLWARENLRVAIGVAQLTDNIYHILLQRLRTGVGVPYEVQQLRVVAVTTRGAEVQARNRYLAAWQQLAATLSQPGAPLTQVTGQLDRPLPLFGYEDVLARVFALHTDVLVARNGVQQQQLLLKLARVTPLPDVDVRAMLQHDFTTPPFHVITSVVVGGKLPVWDRNQGGILQAEALLARANQEEQRVRNDLAGRVADAFERYRNNRVLLELYRADLLPNAVLAFRGLSRRFAVGGEKDLAVDNINYNDVVTSEQALVTAVQAYLGALRDQWLAVTDIAALLQTPDLFATGEELPVAPLPDLEGLVPCVR
jgi:cobalt-zinc-cadmium efflux system outer membrane protein